MLTDYLKDFRIIKVSKQHLTCFNSATKHKLTFVQFPNIHPQTLKRIQFLANLNHPNLLQIYKIQKESKKKSQTKGSFDESVKIGLQIEYHNGSVKQHMGERNFEFEEQQIINTFQPIEEMIQYLISLGWNFTGFSLSNIVITEFSEIKYVDDIIINGGEKQEKFLTNEQVYEIFSEILFGFFIKNKGKQKMWKNKLRALKNHVCKQSLNFFTKIYNKSFVHINDPMKTKKITKKNMKYGINGCQRAKGVEGKENKLILRD